MKLVNNNGCSIAENIRTSWVQEVYNYLVSNKDHEDRFVFYVTSGNALVFGVRDLEGQLDIYDCVINRTYDEWLYNDKTTVPGAPFTF